MGAHGITVRDVRDLEALRTWLDERRGPMVVDCKVDPQLRGDWFSKVFAPGGWYQRMCGH
jgi:thiamine pyrophosphate-dependent acetolactate synthase large subunit-like protein